MLRLLNVLLFFLNVAMLSAAVYFVGTRGYIQGGGWTAPELITVVLAALALLITVLGIFIAVLAVWGYARLSEDAKATASKVAADVAANHAGHVATQVAVAEISRLYGQPGEGFGAAAAREDENASR